MVNQIVGILNLTPDSFSDGGSYPDIQTAVSKAEQMLQDGACLIDIGGESTRPGAKLVSPEEELRRVLPVIQALVSNGISALCLDTRNASTAKACLKAGVRWLNDISALSHDPNMIHVAKDAEKIILMHMRGQPENMQIGPITYSDPIAEIKAYLEKRVEVALQAGFKRDQIYIDPGLGFGKTTAYNLAILNRLAEFKTVGPIFIGPSRKNFIGELTGVKNPADRDFGTIGAVLRAAQNRADLIRVHNPKAAIEALTLFLRVL